MFLLRPSLSRLHSKKCEHSNSHIVIMEILRFPSSLFGFRQETLLLKYKVLSPVTNRSAIINEHLTKKYKYLPALHSVWFAIISAVVKLAVEKLNSNYSKNELEEDVNNKNVYDIFERVYHAIKHSLQFWDSFDGFQWPKHTQDPQGLDGWQVFATPTTSRSPISDG